MNIASVSSDLSFSSTIVAVESNLIASGVAASLPVLIQSNTEISIESASNISNNGYSVDQSIEVPSWNGETNKRFSELALKESVGELALVELAELEQLTRLRRSAKYPRSADEILWERKLRKRTGNLIRALAEYVEFQETTHSA